MVRFISLHKQRRISWRTKAEGKRQKESSENIVRALKFITVSGYTFCACVCASVTVCVCVPLWPVQAHKFAPHGRRETWLIWQMTADSLATHTAKTAKEKQKKSLRIFPIFFFFLCITLRGKGEATNVPFVLVKYREKYEENFQRNLYQSLCKILSIQA